ncbi:MAG TPA: DUF2147 domain-containing protein [Stellaceae bacterium]|jgi:uncharacterized protein (DUF2147 family)|nr:DUF2147 domain-containing protein [Stellaceae bacterium]
MRWSLLPLLLCAAPAWADSAAPVGTWKTIDDETHKARALIEIREHDGVLDGRVIELFRAPDEEPNPRCTDCPGARRDQPVIGMTILWNLHRHGDDWDGGEILDPEDGRVYRCTLHANAAGDRLEVRGYLGVALLGRTQVWERVPPAALQSAAIPSSNPAP